MAVRDGTGRDGTGRAHRRQPATTPFPVLPDTKQEQRHEQRPEQSSLDERLGEEPADGQRGHDANQDEQAVASATGVLLNVAVATSLPLAP